MARVLLTKEQRYKNIDGKIVVGKNGEEADVDDKFLKLIPGKYKLIPKKEEIVQPKAFSKMNKSELVDVLKSNGIELSDDEIEQTTKAGLIKKISEISI